MEWTEFDLYLLNIGKHTKLHEKLGAHVIDEQTIFRVIAPNATKIELLCEFNNYQPLLFKKLDSVVWELVVDENLEKKKYKYLVDHLGYQIEKNDPFSFMCEVRPFNSSIVTKVEKSTKEKRSKKDVLNIYEMHLKGYKKNLTNYKDIAQDVANYCHKMNYNYVEFMPIMEHPQDKSWGYQITNYYAPTSRYGTPKDFKQAVDILHDKNIGVILDWVPVHFANDFYALVNFDGTPTFESNFYHDAVNDLWGTINFDLSKGLVQSFLISNLFYYIEYYNVDGFRIDAVSNIIYWRGEHDGTLNNEAINFIKSMNSLVKEYYPNVLMIAEDSTNYPGVTSELGFDYKWCLGWMHDSLKYFSLDFEDRKIHFNYLTFSFNYMFNEKYILPLSHDEVVHIKGSILNKMYGAHDEKMRQLKVYYTYKFMHPGQKLNFMGNDLATYIEFSEEKEIEWVNSNNHVHKLFKKLGQMLLNNKAFSDDHNFMYLHEHVEKGILVFKRGNFTIIINTQVYYYNDFEIYMNNNKTCYLYLDTNWEEYGGENIKDIQNIKPVNKKITYSINPLSAVIIKEGICKPS